MNLAKFQFTTWINYFNKKNTPSKQDIHAHLTTSADHIFICLWLKWRNDEGKSYALSINGWTRSNLTYKVINALFCLWIIWLFCSAPFAGRLPIWVCLCVCGVHHKRNSNDCKFKFSTKWSQCAKDSWQWTQKKPHQDKCTRLRGGDTFRAGS